jgi:hypothetical protein
MIFRRVVILASLVLLAIPWTTAEAGWWLRNRRYRAYYVTPGPVYVQPYPVYVQPVPVQPAPVYVQPGPFRARLVPVPPPPRFPVTPEPIAAPVP